MTVHYEERVARLRQSMAQRDLRAMIISNPPNRRYFSGFTGEDSGTESAGMLVIGPETVQLVTDSRYVARSGEEAPSLSVVKRGLTASLEDIVAEVVQSLGAYSIGFESDHLTDARRRALSAKAGGAWALVPTIGFGDDLRAVKDESEVALIREAAALTDAAFARFLEVAHPGVSERALAWEMERFMRENGAEGLAFSVDVAAGAHAAMPHALLTEYPLAPGDPVVVDMGARIGGYCADMTRTVLLAGGTDTNAALFHKIYHSVLEAQQSAMATIKAGMTGGQADAVARSLIEAAGYGAEFSHGLGHGVGLEIHERPALRRTDTNVLTPGMVVTVEPGIYITGWGGVRIEDLAVVRADGLERLSWTAKELLVL